MTLKGQVVRIEDHVVGMNNNVRIEDHVVGMNNDVRINFVKAPVVRINKEVRINVTGQGARLKENSQAVSVTRVP